MYNRIEGYFYYLIGVAFLAAAKAKHLLQGYSTPKPFSIDQADEAYDYAADIAERLMGFHKSYTGQNISGRRVLELGPGSDLCLGLYLVSKQADSYHAFDRNNLESQVPPGYYDKFAQRYPVDLTALQDNRVNYCVNEDFDLSVLPQNYFDTVFSNAAFEHFDDVEHTIAQLTATVASGCNLVMEVDLKTHTRWIRDKDPNNIYRYGEGLYRLFYFPGQPNRMRPEQYQDILQRHGWTDITMQPASSVPSHMQARRMHKRFEGSDMVPLSVVFCARKP